MLYVKWDFTWVFQPTNIDIWLISTVKTFGKTLIFYLKIDMHEVAHKYINEA